MWSDLFYTQKHIYDLLKTWQAAAVPILRNSIVLIQERCDDLQIGKNLIFSVSWHFQKSWKKAWRQRLDGWLVKKKTKQKLF